MVGGGHSVLLSFSELARKEHSLVIFYRLACVSIEPTASIGYSFQTEEQGSALVA